MYGQMRLWGMFTVEELLEAWPEWFDLRAKITREPGGILHAVSGPDTRYLRSVA